VKRSINTIVIEPGTVLREGLVSLLHGSGFKVISAVAAPDRVSPIALERASILIVGALSEPAETLDYLKRCSSAGRDPKIVIISEISGNGSQSDALKFLSNGADCCIFSVHSRDILLRSLDLVLLGQRVVVLGPASGPGSLEAVAAESKIAVPAEAAESRVTVPAAETLVTPIESKFVDPFEDDARISNDCARRLSARELEILSLLVAGDSNKAIARTCHLAESTVKIHLKTILRKIRVRNRTQAAIWALQNTNGHANNGEAA
jgi:two-component system nitrate/nitrite response regulator NarL